MFSGVDKKYSSEFDVRKYFLGFYGPIIAVIIAIYVIYRLIKRKK